MFVDKTKYRGWKQLKNKIIFYLFLLIAIFIQTTNAQDDLILQNMTISTTETYEAANSITAGPGFTITSTGVVTFISGDFIKLKPGFVVVGGGEFYGLTGVSTNLITNTILEIPTDFVLQQNYPNPFNPTTNIEFSIPEASEVILKIYNNLGEEIATLVSNRLNAGKYTYSWGASELASGVYLYRLEAKDPSQGAGQSFIETKKMILMR